MREAVISRLEKLITFAEKNRVSSKLIDCLINIPKANVQNFKIFGRGNQKI